ncbi:hypothetical protein KKE26_05525 [bacterium]|nr:hypothetical protein [bacterium]
MLLNEEHKPQRHREDREQNNLTAQYPVAIRRRLKATITIQTARTDTEKEPQRV